MRINWAGARVPGQGFLLRFLVYRDGLVGQNGWHRPMARILVIDDDPDLRAMLEQTLKSAGHEVSVAADGREGVEQFQARTADLVITDLYMPKQEGLETIRELRARFPEVAIIAMSGKAAALAMLFVAQKLGAVGILHKPFSVDELHAAVRNALAGGRDAG